MYVYYLPLFNKLCSYFAFFLYSRSLYGEGSLGLVIRGWQRLVHKLSSFNQRLACWLEQERKGVKSVYSGESVQLSRRRLDWRRSRVEFDSLFGKERKFLFLDLKAPTVLRSHRPLVEDCKLLPCYWLSRPRLLPPGHISPDDYFHYSIWAIVPPYVQSDVPIVHTRLAWKFLQAHRYRAAW